MDRAQRIFHERRIKRRVQSYTTAGDRSPRAIGLAARSPKMCACWMCRNPKYYEGDKVKYRALDQRRLLEGWIS